MHEKGVKKKPKVGNKEFSYEEGNFNQLVYWMKEEVIDTFPKDLVSPVDYKHEHINKFNKNKLKKILRKNDFDVLEFNASEMRNQKLIKDKLSKVNGNINIIDCMCAKKKHMGVIFDEIDGLSSGEKSGITEIISIIFDKSIESSANL